MIVLALDALDHRHVQRFGCKNLLQLESGKTDISEFEQPRTVVLWAAFLTGENLEQEIPIQTQWNFKLAPEDTLLSFFRTYKTVDVPAFSLKEKNHAEERRLLKAYFSESATVDEYDKIVWKHHEENKREFLEAVGRYELVMGYFDLADAIGHLSFGITEKMADIYRELDRIAEGIKDCEDFTLIVSDHGMEPVGRYGDHSGSGFYSSNRRLRLNKPRITDFYSQIRSIYKNGST